MTFVNTLVSLILWIVVGWYVVQWLRCFCVLGRANVHRSLSQPQNKAARGCEFEARTETETFTRVHRVEDGIEWISYLPKQRKHETPILMQHGMWHGAWCWQQWQEILAAAGWESHAISLPGHGLSPEQRPIPHCTLDYYLAFVRDAVEKLPRKPVLMGHSMGGALTQWYLRYVGQLPAAVLVAPWSLYKGFLASAWAFIKLDLLGQLLSMITFRAEFTRSPHHAARTLISKDAIISPEELYARLGSESVMVMMQHMLPWKLPKALTTPMFWLCGDHDAVIPEYAARRSAGGYHADYEMVPGAAHNLMMEHNTRETADHIVQWLEKQKIA